MSGYIGTQPVPQATQTRDSFTATSGQTSFATGGYTPQFLSVYLNGIFLNNGADYTAANGSDVILTTGAATGDILEVVAFTTFTVGSSFTPSIDDNGNATAITIDSSENVLVGKTTIGIANVGGELRADGQITGTKDGGAPLALNRKTSDGDIALFQKNGGTVGTIGAVSGNDLFIVNQTKGLRFQSDAGFIQPCNSTGSDSDNTLDLGQANSRFKDLYLSGGVYLGGTGSANKLEDYEEGTFTVSTITTSGSITLKSSVNILSYTKVGRVVTITGRISVSSVSSPSGSVKIVLPFVVANTTLQSGHAFLNGSTHDVNLGSGAIGSTWECNPGTSDAYLLVLFNNASWQSNNVAQKFDGSGNEYISVTGSYIST